jgi:hypothetical protein
MKEVKKLSPMQSKKFLAYLFADIGWKAIILYQLMHLKGKLEINELTFLITTVITAGVIQIGYILGTASLEKYLASAVEIFDRDDNTPKKKG